MSTLTTSSAWLSLQAHQPVMAQRSLRELFARDPQRFNNFSLKFNDILMDYSKHPISLDTINLLLALARQQGLEARVSEMFCGERINYSENRAALHTALRREDSLKLDGVDIMPDIRHVLTKMEKFSDSVRNGELKGYSGHVFTDIVNIGIGGSYLGPVMVTEALKPYSTNHISSHFISNIDGTDLSTTLKKLNPATTLFIIASKTFTTQETMANARAAREWFLAKGGSKKNIADHFVAVSTNRTEVEKFGINVDNIFKFWDWVGGRYSLWSAIGLSIALSIGMENFYLLLKGAREMDQHFIAAPMKKNLPVILGLIGIWQINFFGTRSHAVLPYDQSLHRFPAYLQQLEMESNGKRVDLSGNEVDYSTGTVVWGEPGTNGQHAFYQLLHQGTQIIPADFLVPCISHNPVGDQHGLLLANFLAQTEAMMKGKDKSEVYEEYEVELSVKDSFKRIMPHKVFPGGRPTTSILFKKLDPETLGSLIALYEHKVFVQSVIWNINPFDQWGVELGKQLAGKISDELNNDMQITSHDSSTNGLINYFKKNR
jgi:glucose-6-phosphate isomerase